MNLDEETLQKIGKFLNLEQIVLKQKIELLLYVNETNDHDFEEKLDFLKGMFKNVIFNIVEKGEISDAKNIISGTIGNDGSS
jgi:hypothetical protein